MTKNRTSFKPGTRANPHGAPRKMLPASSLKLITADAARGCREKDIARTLGMSAPTWVKCLAEQDEVRAAFDAGRQLLHDALIGKLYERAMSGKSDACLIFATKVLLGYRENDVAVEFRPQINITLPGALPLEKFAALEHEGRKLLTRDAVRG